MGEWAEPIWTRPVCGMKTPDTTSVLEYFSCYQACCKVSIPINNFNAIALFPWLISQNHATSDQVLGAHRGIVRPKLKDLKNVIDHSLDIVSTMFTPKSATYKLQVKWV